MAYPIDTATSFVRDPVRYPHDAFGHDGADGCARRMPHTGTDVSPKRRGDTSAPVLSPIGGVIAEYGFDREAGNYHLIAGDDGRAWGLGHHSTFLRTAGRVELGTPIALMGMTGGALGVHTHVWCAVSMDAARRIVTGLVNLRRGRTVAEWAASMGGLVDPYPHYAAAIAAEDQRIAKAKAEAEAKALAEALREDNEMRVIVGPSGAWVLLRGTNWRSLASGEGAAALAICGQTRPIILSQADFDVVARFYGRAA